VRHAGTKRKKEQSDQAHSSVVVIGNSPRSLDQGWRLALGVCLGGIGIFTVLAMTLPVIRKIRRGQAFLGEHLGHDEHQLPPSDIEKLFLSYAR
jgi:hypothetical protein